MSHRDLETEVIAEVRRIVGDEDGDEDGDAAYAIRPRPADAQLVALLERLRGLPAGLGVAELRRRLGALADG